MNKILLSITIALISSIGIAQNNFPTQEEAEKFIKTDKKLRQEVTEKLGVPWEKLTIESDDRKGYKGTVFSLSLTNCGKNIRARGESWPDDAAYAKWIVTTPKNDEGIYKQMGIYMDYKRTTYDGELCRLGDWSFNGYRLEGGSEYGHKEFTVEEMKSLFYTEAKAGRIDALKYFIEIEQPLDKDFGQNSPQPGPRYIYAFFKGTMAKYAPDHSIVYCEDSDVYKVQLSVEKSDGVWKVVNSTLLSKYLFKIELDDFQQKLDQYCEFPETEVNFESYESAGWDAVYQKRTPKPTDQGKYGQLKKRIDALYTLLIDKGTNLTEEDLKAFVLPSRHKDLNLKREKVGSIYYMPFET